ncbi:MAG: hypothetical protein GWP08_10675 [Nitrospiraceae bacterium]|nr:hypothetical protein [Nitrospiraceae bacterium]
MADDYAARFPDVPCISAEMLKPLLRPSGEVVLLDTRAPEEYKVSRIPDAVPLREFERNIEAYRGKKIVAYCTIGYRSGRYAAKLRKEGFDVHNLRGGILAWVHADGALENESGATKRVHVYGRDWDLAPEDYETEW